MQSLGKKTYRHKLHVMRICNRLPKESFSQHSLLIKNTKCGKAKLIKYYYFSNKIGFWKLCIIEKIKKNDREIIQIRPCFD